MARSFTRLKQRARGSGAGATPVDARGGPHRGIRVPPGGRLRTWIGARLPGIGRRAFACIGTLIGTVHGLQRMAHPPRPVMHRSVHQGAILLLVGMVQFFAAMIACQLAYPGYSDLTNVISDLGNTANSPLWYVFAVSLAIFGVFLALGVVLIYSSLAPGALRAFGVLLLMIAGLAAIVVAANPENLRAVPHTVAALTVFTAGGIGILFLGYRAMPRSSHWEWLGSLSIVLGAITLVALLVLVTGTWGALGQGGIERIVIGPVMLWAVIVAVHLLRLPVRAAPRILSKA